MCLLPHFQWGESRGGRALLGRFPKQNSLVSSPSSLLDRSARTALEDLHNQLMDTQSRDNLWG